MAGDLRRLVAHPVGRSCIPFRTYRFNKERKRVGKGFQIQAKEIKAAEFFYLLNRESSSASCVVPQLTLAWLSGLSVGLL